jgi:hypothetical protein
MNEPQENRYWFPAKRYGWGWGPPITWQGWVVTVVWFGAVIGGARRLLPQHTASFVIFTLFMCCLLVVICYVTGEPPRWRNGE